MECLVIRRIANGALVFRGLILALATILCIGGMISLRKAPVDLLPEFTPPYVEIQTESLGLSAQEVEQYLTVPMEADLLNGVEGAEVLRSKSTAGLSSIVMVFEQGYDVYKGRQLIQERLTQLNGAAFPHISKAPVVLPPLSSSSRVLMVGLSGKGLTPIQKSVIARWTIKPKLLGIQGVSDVHIWGMRDQQLQVQANPQKLEANNVTLSQVVATAGNAQIASPVTYLEGSVPGTGGFIETPSQRLPVRTVFDNIASPKALGQVPIEGTDGQLKLSDVASIVTDHQPLIGDAIVGDHDGLLLVIDKFPGADSREITAQIREKLGDLKPGLGGMTVDTHVFEPASVIDSAVHNTLLALGLGLLLGAIVLFGLVRSFRRTLVSLVAVAASLIAAALTLTELGETLNAMTIAGIALAITVLVDDAVAGVQKLVERGDSADPMQTIRDALVSARRPLGYASLMAAVAATPVIVMEGRPGAFYGPLAVAYVVSILVGTVIAVTLTPALAAVLPARKPSEPRLGRLAAWNDKVLTRAFAAAPTVLVITAVVALLTLITTPLLNEAVVPQFKDRDLVIRLDAPPGTSNTHMTAIGTNLSKRLHRIDGVDSVVGAMGRAVTGDRIVDVNSGELDVEISPQADYDQTYEKVEDAANAVHGAIAVVSTSSAQRIRDVGAITRGENNARGGGLDVMAGVDRPITVRIYGQNYEKLNKQAHRLLEVVSATDGINAPEIEQPLQSPTVEILVDLDRAAQYGLKPGDVRRSEAIMLQGILVGSVFKDQKVFEVVVKGTPDVAKNVTALKNLLIDTDTGAKVRLSQVASVREGKTPTVIARDAVSRYLDITADVQGRSVESVADELESRLREIPMPEEYHSEVLDMTVQEEINLGNMLVGAAGAALLALLLFQALLRSWRLALGALVASVAATSGALIATLVLFNGLTLSAIAGLVVVGLLAARYVATLLRHIQDVDAAGTGSTADAVRRGLAESRSDIVVSALVSAAVALPAALLGSRTGLEILSPLAVTVLCGLVSVLLVVLVVAPTLYLTVRKSGHEPSLIEDEATA